MIKKLYYKKMKKLYYAIENILLVPIIPLLFILNIRFVRLITARIGHLAGNTDLFLRRIQLSMIKKRKRLIIVSDTPPANKQLLKMFKRVMSIKQIPFIFFQEISETFSKPESILNKLDLYKNLPLDSNEYYEWENAKPNLFFTKFEEQKGQKLLKKMNIKGEFICFHSRDSVYLNKKYKVDKKCKENWSYHDYRDSNIGNYLKAVQYITSKGNYAIRMGQYVAKKLPDLKNKKIIDYATYYRTDFGDIYLPTKCKFFLGSPSGIMQASQIFNVPVAWANVIPFETPPWSSRDLYIPKKIWSIKKKRFLTFREILDSGIGMLVDGQKYATAGLKVVENSPEEIYDLAKEMNERLDGTWKTAKEDEELQKKFKSLFKPNSLCYGCPARVGAKFLRENKKLLE